MFRIVILIFIDIIIFLVVSFLCNNLFELLIYFSLGKYVV